MSRKKIPNKKVLEDVLRQLDGNMAAAARHFHCHRSLVWQYVNSDPGLAELVEELSEAFIDEAESQLFQQIRDGNTAAIIFFLKTRARHRGYSERLELVPLRAQEIEVELGSPTQIKSNQSQAFDRDSPAVALLEQ